MRVYIGVDFHARKQTVSYLTTEDGEIRQLELDHEKDDIRGFYEQFRWKTHLVNGNGWARSANRGRGCRRMRDLRFQIPDSRKHKAKHKAAISRIGDHMKPTMRFVINGCLVILVSGVAAGVQAQTKKPITREGPEGSWALKEPWQTDWKLFIGTLTRRTHVGVDPGTDPFLLGKQVEFEGVLRTAFNPAMPDAPLELEMPPYPLHAALRMFPNSDPAKGHRPTVITMSKVLVKPARAGRSAWQNLKVGSTVRFRATIGKDVTWFGPLPDGGGEEPGEVLVNLQAAEVRK
jgi:hypothetical protein